MHSSVEHSSQIWRLFHEWCKNECSLNNEKSYRHLKFTIHVQLHINLNFQQAITSDRNTLLKSDFLLLFNLVDPHHISKIFGRHPTGLNNISPNDSWLHLATSKIYLIIKFVAATYPLASFVTIIQPDISLRKAIKENKKCYVIDFMKEQMFCVGDPTRHRFESPIAYCKTQIVN
jgi:hypothetical protein